MDLEAPRLGLEGEILGFGVDAGLDKVLVLPREKENTLKFQLLNFPFHELPKSSWALTWHIWHESQRKAPFPSIQGLS